MTRTKPRAHRRDGISVEWRLIDLAEQAEPTVYSHLLVRYGRRCRNSRLLLALAGALYPEKKGEARSVKNNECIPCRPHLMEQSDVCAYLRDDLDSSA